MVQLLEDRRYFKEEAGHKGFEAKTSIEAGRNKRGAIGLFFSSSGG